MTESSILEPISFQPSAITLQALVEGLQAESGQVIVRTEGGKGNILLQEGRIAGVRVPAPSVPLLEQVADDMGFDPGEIEAIRRESRETGESPLNLFLLWGQCDPEALRARVKERMREGVIKLIELASTAALFIPNSVDSRDFLYQFEVAEIFPELTERLDAIALATDHEAKVESTCSALLQDVDGALSVALVHLLTRRTVVSASRRRPLPPTPVGILNLFDPQGKESARQVFVAARESMFFLRKLRIGDWALVVGCESDVVVGSGWFAVKSAAVRIEELLASGG